MWLEQLANEAREVRDDLTTNKGGLEVELFETWQKIGLLLQANLGDRIDGVQAVLAAGLLYNPYGWTGATWPELGAEYGSTRSKEALEILRAAQNDLSASKGLDLTPNEMLKLRESIIWKIQEFSQPNWVHVKTLAANPQADLAQVLHYLCMYHEGCVEEEKAAGRGKVRAYRTAVALRAIFEIYADLKAKSGDWFSEPSGPFCTCLHGIYKIAKIDATFRYYATKAKDVPDDDEGLIWLKEQLLQGVDMLGDFRPILSFTDRS